MALTKRYLKKIPVLGSLARRVYRSIKGGYGAPKHFPGSGRYWEERYASGGNSGAGSYDKFAEFKAQVLNAFVAKNGVNSVIEFGCGDGNQLELAKYPVYLGLDVSETAVSLCRSRFALDQSKRFKLVSDYHGEPAELVLSLDVVYHLVEDAVFESYVKSLFGAASRFVIIYSSNHDNNAGYERTHVRHRKFTDWIERNVSGWQLKKHIPNRYPYQGNDASGSFADFYIYKKC